MNRGLDRLLKIDLIKLTLALRARHRFALDRPCPLLARDGSAIAGVAVRRKLADGVCVQGWHYQKATRWSHYDNLDAYYRWLEG
jgi:hypothetical protein